MTDHEIALAALVVTAGAGVGTWLCVPQLQDWLKNWFKRRQERLAPTTLGDLGGAKQYEVPLALGIVKADRVTLAALQEALPSANINWLHEKDFGNAFPRKSIEKIEEFNWYHAGPEHEFLDPELESMRLALMRCIDHLASTAGWNSVCISPGVDNEMRKIPDQYDEEGNYSDPLFFEKAKEINDAAEAVWETYLKLIRRARLKLALRDVEEEQ